MSSAEKFIQSAKRLLLSNMISKLKKNIFHFLLTCLKTAEWVANSVDSDHRFLWRLIWVYTICSGLTVRSLRVKNGTTPDRSTFSSY